MSRCAMAKRVTLSMRHKTSRPVSHRNSETDIIMYPPWRRISADWSPVATTTTLRARPSGPRSSWTNSWTSRPRSPINPITFTSADVKRAIIERSTDLPIPEPEKIPIRCPRQHVVNVLSERTPRSTLSPIRCRVFAAGGPARMRYPTLPRVKGGPPSKGSSRGLMIRPSQVSSG